MTQRSMTDVQNYYCVTFFVALLACCVGCNLPEPKAPTIDGDLSANKATQLQSKIRSQNAPKFSIEHEFNGKPFTAQWEISNALQRHAKLQIKPPVDWSLAELDGALGVVMAAHPTKPWYGKIDDTVFRLFRIASEDASQSAHDLVPGTPYDIRVKVKQHTKEWMLEVKVKIVNENGSPLGI